MITWYANHTVPGGRGRRAMRMNAFATRRPSKSSSAAWLAGSSGVRTPARSHV